MDKLFSEMSREEKLDTFEHYIDGNKIEVKVGGNGRWKIAAVPSFNPRNAYRKALTKPSINWDHVAKQFEYMATDSSGLTFLYKEKPELRSLCYVSELGCTLASGFASFVQGTCDFKDSLVQRPFQS